MARITESFIVENGRACHYCGRLTYLWRGTKFQPWAATRDHVNPRARGGGLTVLACRSCNESKSDMTGQEFIYFRATGRFAPTYVLWLEAASRMRGARGGDPVPAAPSDPRERPLTPLEVANRLRALRTQEPTPVGAASLPVLS